MRYDPVNCTNVIVAAAVLHNFGIDHGDDFEFQPNRPEPEEDDFHYQGDNNVKGIALRRSIILNYFS